MVAPEQPAKNRLDICCLQSARQAAPFQRPMPFFPEVHDEISHSWCCPYSTRIQPMGSYMFHAVDGADRVGYLKPPPIEEAFSTHLCPAARGWISTPLLPSEPCRTTNLLAEKGVFSMLHSLDEEGLALKKTALCYRLGTQSYQDDGPEYRSQYGQPCHAAEAPVTDADRFESV
ncbi:hypothetical protein E1301_Tti018957 [Triplophysa tibetana]|uniref:Uncharacterized protein n=1 Tax=Triplophysa tibetana TaxID=1572043 RepID=A0A5A9N0J9_9TELE|nr:hypothetical protein E1301_Tti018957 [Triplophysa tibetana]